MAISRSLISVLAAVLLAANPTDAAVDGLFPNVGNVARRLPVTVGLNTRVSAHAFSRASTTPTSSLPAPPTNKKNHQIAHVLHSFYWLRCLSYPLTVLCIPCQAHAEEFYVVIVVNMVTQPPPIIIFLFNFKSFQGDTVQRGEPRNHQAHWCQPDFVGWVWHLGRYCAWDCEYQVLVFFLRKNKWENPSTALFS